MRSSSCAAMLRGVRCFALLATLVSVACAPAAQEDAGEIVPGGRGGPSDPTSTYPTESDPADIEAIRTFFRQVEASINAGEFEVWFAKFTDDAVFMPPGAPAVAKETQRAVSLEFFAGHDMQETFVLDEIEVAGDWAFARATYDFQATPKAGGATMAEQGKILWILARQSDGSWLSTRAIWNGNSPILEE